MCHPSFDLLLGLNDRERPRLRLLRAAGAAREVVSQQKVPNRGGDGGKAAKKCVCSNTSHPGSFRCRYHRNDYKWVGRVRTKSSYVSCL
ncbi:hypothetical protein OWV82_009869 [Melia azedarach]|uniref:Uncharacterized protein n=1 Tax=Melia azedarach TaxID=155640 RepID=A0ACC1Y4M6_MELAZ|nr:hypothetical protein OWV82_009869 [Melia azedarach]